MMEKHYDIDKIVKNASTLSDPVAMECFAYECEDYDGLYDVTDEIEELSSLLPESINLLDLPDLYSGSISTKIYGLCTCSATKGHHILEFSSEKHIIFNDDEEAEFLGYRPCAKCMKHEYLAWKRAQVASDNQGE